MWLEYVNIRQESRLYLKILDKKENNNQYKPIITIIIIDP